MRRLTWGMALAIAIIASPGSAPAIVGGSNASAGEYPFMTAVFTGSSPADGQYCGGSLVAPTLVLTAAHCVLELVDNAISGLPIDLLDQKVKVHIGAVRLSEGGEQILVTRSTVHPNADLDMAVLELARASSFAPVDWARPSDAAAYEPGTLATVAGWGLTTEGGSGSDRLRDAQVPVISDTKCANAYPGRTVPGTEVCAGYDEGGVDTCQGDSGGPMLVRDGGEWLLVGITSWGHGCAQAGKPGVYAEVAAGTAFIKSF